MKPIPIFIQIVFILFLLHNSVPIIGIKMPMTLYVLLMFIMYVFLFKHKITVKKDIIKIFPILFIGLLPIIYGIQEEPIKHLYSLFQTVLYPLFALYLIRNRDFAAIKRIFIVILLSLVVTGFTTFAGCQIYPEASRHLATAYITEDDLNVYGNLNIGGIGFIYGLPLIFPMLFYIMKSRMVNRYLVLMIMISMMMAILASQYTIALLLMAVSVLGCFFPHIIDSKKTYIYISIFLVVLFLGGNYYLGKFFLYISENIDSEMVAERLLSLSYLMQGKTGFVDGDVEARQMLYTNSIKGFLESPIYGGERPGGHSYVLDHLCKYGLLGLLAMAMLYKSIYKYFFKRYMKTEISSYLKLIIFLAIILAVFNPIVNVGLLTLYITLFALLYEAKNNAKCTKKTQ